MKMQFLSCLALGLMMGAASAAEFPLLYELERACDHQYRSALGNSLTFDGTMMVQLFILCSTVQCVEHYRVGGVPGLLGVSPARHHPCV